MLDLLQSMEVVLGVAALVLFVLYYLTKSRPNLPPGPPSWPIFGSALSLQKMGLNMIESIREMRAKYGDVFRITRFGRHFIYVNGMENLREIFIKRADAFSDRPSNYHTEYILKGHGILASSGTIWKEHRTFALTTLRGFGFGRRCLESQIMEEVTCLSDKIAALDGKPFDPNEYIHVSVSNVMCSIAFGKRYEHSDADFQHMLTLVTKLLIVPRRPVLGMFPFLGKLPGDFFGAKELHAIEDEVKDFVGRIISEHKESFDGENIRDYIDAFLLEQTKHQNNEDSTFSGKASELRGH